jgi:hypothetical protein
MGSWALALAPVFVAGCVLAPPGLSSVGTIGGGPGTSSAGTAGQITVPNLLGLPKEQAMAALRRAGYQGEATEDSSLCGSVVDGRVNSEQVVFAKRDPDAKVSSPEGRRPAPDRRRPEAGAAEAAGATEPGRSVPRRRHA